MNTFLKNKKGIAPLFIILFVIIALIVIYLFLFIPIPAFTRLRTIINYFLIVIFWIILQVGLVYGYVKLGGIAIKSFTSIRTKMVNWSLNIKKFIITHS
jgi:hypothetical protein